uniref:Uncharacterized protein n=1 Tax=Phlegmariurus squarrosus TaxID=73615 RepID=H9M859_PHLSQ|nr:hypothetical protein HusqMp77 [Phlegmariurus squarrosus]AEV55766.1 hypothetical protein HusqMp77 [Phlegmariurus squarrosus]
MLFSSQLGLYAAEAGLERREQIIFPELENTQACSFPLRRPLCPLRRKVRSEKAEKSAELLRCGGAVISRPPQVPWKLLRGGGFYTCRKAFSALIFNNCGAAPELVRRLSSWLVYDSLQPKKRHYP